MTTFSLVTLNCFGVPVPSTASRLLALARELVRRGDSVVCLQEVQAHSYRELLVRACAPAYPSQAHAPHVHAPRGGLLTLAQQPITAQSFTLYTARGLWYTPALTDWVLYKGVLATRLLYDGVPVVVLNTHLTANYSGDWRPNNRYARNEWLQLRQLAAVVREQPPDTLVLVVGDFNIPRGSWLYDGLLAESGLCDPLAGDRRPTIRLPRGVPGRYAHPIDFALLRAPALPGLRVESDLCFCQKIARADGQQIFPSDHCGVELRVSWG